MNLKLPAVIMSQRLDLLWHCQWLHTCPKASTLLCSTCPQSEQLWWLDLANSSAQGRPLVRGVWALTNKHCQQASP